MNAYSTVRNTSFATIVVAALAGIVSNGLAIDQRIILEREPSAEAGGRRDRPPRGRGDRLAA